MVAVRSFTRGAQIAPKKLRIILDEVRDKRVDEAMSILRFMQSAARAHRCEGRALRRRERGEQLQHGPTPSARHAGLRG